jgi:hypothetical protein
MNQTNQESKSSKIFEDWDEIDCNECAKYWDNSCDGVKSSLNGSKRLCNSFLATRSVVIPQELKRLKTAIKWLKWSVVILAVIELIILGLEVFT